MITIEVKANSLEEARVQLEARTPTGLALMSEKVISIGGNNKVRSMASTIRGAKEKVRAAVPIGAEVLSICELASPHQETISIEAYDEMEAMQRLQTEKGDLVTVESIRLVRPSKKGFLGLGRTIGQYALDVFVFGCVEVEYLENAILLGTYGDSSEQIVHLAKELAGGWPVELPHDTFDSTILDRLVARLREYQDMVHRGYDSKPHYEIINGEIVRGCRPFEDIVILTAAKHLSGKGIISPLDGKLVASYTFTTIMRYAQTTLAKFLFFLPRVSDEYSELSKRRTVTQELTIDVYKGVENVLYEIYDELPDGASFDDATVTSKLLSIVETAKL